LNLGGGCARSLLAAIDAQREIYAVNAIGSAFDIMQLERLMPRDGSCFVGVSVYG
jgi:hypothetical protein